MPSSSWPPSGSSWARTWRPRNSSRARKSKTRSGNGKSWIGWRASGAAPDFGRRLASTYFAAGLPAPTVEAIIPVATGPESPLLDWIARSLRSLGPMLEKTGVSLPAGLDSGDLIEQWRKAVTTDGVQLQGPVQYGAWTQIP